MSGFVRRYSNVPSLDVITAIEGVIILDQTPPTTSTGVTTNVVALVGEFADMTYATTCDVNGAISTFPNPVEIFSGADLVNKLGGFDKTLGQFGNAMGNGYVELRNKAFGRLIVVPINLASPSGIRLWRLLPTNKSATDPTPVVPVSAAVVPAGFLLKDNAQALERLAVGASVPFTADVAYLGGVDGSVTNAAAAATNTFTSAGGGFTTVSRPDGKVGAQIGDILVTGVIGAGTPQGDDSGQHRIVSITSDTIVVVQSMDGTNFAWTTTNASIVWRLHPGAAADSSADFNALLANQGSFRVPARPLTKGDGTGSSGTDGTWATGVSLVPLITPPALTATSADPLSGLAGKVGPTVAVAFAHLIQRPNPANDATIDALYTTAIASLLNDDVPESEVAHVWAARKSATIRSTVLTHCQQQSARGVGRTCSISPELNINQTPTTALTTVTGTADPGVGAHRDERLFYDWPATKTLVPEAVGIPISTADGQTTFDGVIDVTSDGWMASIMGSLAPERNPGESSPVTQQALAPILGYARGTPQLDINAWTLMRQRGIAGIRIDASTGPEFQSGVTSSQKNGEKNIARRKMADYIEDSLAVIVKPFVKLPISLAVIDSAVTQVTDFMDTLLSADNVSFQRIAGYLVDPVSGNTPAMYDLGIFVIVVKARTLASADFIVIQVQAGNGVVTTSQVG